MVLKSFVFVVNKPGLFDLRVSTSGKRTYDDDNSANSHVFTLFDLWTSPAYKYDVYCCLFTALLEGNVLVVTCSRHMHAVYHHCKELTVL